MTREIYILAGQSNMSGRGLVSEAPTYENISSIHVFGNDYAWHQGMLDPIDTNTSQVDSVSSDGNAGVGPGLAFANRMATLRPGVEIGLVPCAMGGTKMTQWAKDWRRSSLYGSMLYRARQAALAGELKGLIWWQGEGDCGCYDYAPYAAMPGVLEWPVNFVRFISDIREDLGTPNLPIVFAQLSAEPTGSWDFAAWGGKQAQQQQIADANMPNVKMIVTSDLPAVSSTSPHVTTAGAVQAGIRFADTMASML